VAGIFGEAPGELENQPAHGVVGEDRATARWLEAKLTADGCEDGRRPAHRKLIAHRAPLHQPVAEGELWPQWD
jgi:hypothetical protein